MRNVSAVLAAGLLLAIGTPAGAVLLAFPGAEGAGKYTAGGRGGDVYTVTNLADSGPGSLRYGVDSAPLLSGRTIVFAVSGTIQLLSDLKVDSHSMTIAGQTAPGGGITLSGHVLQVQDTNDVIIQYLRLRPGDLYTQPTNPTGYQPDSLGVTNSTRVMIDHVSASWSIDEVLSVTHFSNYVTVQWSMITEALKNAGHPKGAHSYGSLINGSDITYAHNLYADNDSRNPRPEGAPDTNYPGTLRLDFVNNVVENPGSRFGYSGDNVSSNDDFQMNYVGNYGISGPSTSSSAALFRPASTATEIYVPAGSNYLDYDKDGVLDGTPATGTRLINGTYTSSGTRFNLPEVTTFDATQAYIQVVSRAGASAYRDEVDRRIARSVVNQTGAIIDSQNQVGGYPVLPSGTAPVDSNGDGVPDAWASANYGDISTPLNTTFAPSGYTYLEEYLHSLTPYAYAPAATTPVTISTADGRGQDAQVNEDDNVSSGSNSDQLNVRFSDTNRNEYTLVSFDLASIEPGSITGAQLELTAFRDASGTNDLKVYGLVHDAANWDWNEDTVEFDGAPALEFDANSATRGLVADDVYSLGTLNADGLLEGDVATFDNPNLAVFLNLAAYFEGEAEAGLVTLLLEKTTTTSTQTRFASKEATGLETGFAAPAGTYAPRLVLDAVLASITPLAGDYNDDGVVDAADYTVWRDTLGSATDLRADGDGDGDVDGDDFVVWKTHFGQTAGSGSLAQTAAVPEPTSLTVMVVLGGMLLATRRRWV